MIQSPIMAKTHNIVSILSFGLLLSVGCGGNYKQTGIDTVRAQKGDLAACIGEASQRNASLKGKAAAMDLVFEIAPDGGVQSATVDKDKAGDPGLVDCLTQRARTWRFPAPPSGKVEKFTYQFNARFP